MSRRIVAALVAVLAAALLLATAPPRAEAISFVDKQVQAGGLLIQNYIDKYGASHGFVFPPKTMVKKGGGLPDSRLMWPANPWTGRVMAPGTARGTYTYTLGAGGTSYRLTMHFSSGNYTFRGSMPAWLKTERGAAAAQLTAARDQTAELGARVVKGYVDQWGLLSNGSAPAAADVAPGGALAALFGWWPANPFTGEPMASSTAAGDFTYTQGGAGAYTLLARASGGKSTDLSGAVPQQVHTALEALKTSLTNANVWKIRSAVDRFARDHAGYLPEAATPNLLGAYLDPWPANPFVTGELMTDGSTSPGGFVYVRSLAGTYTITAYVSGGSAGETLSGPLFP